MRSRLLFLALAAGCASTATARDVRSAFSADVRDLRPEVADQADFRALRTVGAAPMARTIERGERYLQGRRREGVNRDYVRALLACAYLTRGRVDEAARLARAIDVPGRGAPERERRVIASTRWLVDACFALEGRARLDALLERGEGIVPFLETFGSRTGYPLPPPHHRDYLAELGRYSTDLHAVLLAPAPRTPQEDQARTRRIRELRRSLAEFVYDDAAAFKQTLIAPDAPDREAEDEFFSMALSSLFVSLAYLSDDLVPRVRLEFAQKAWMRQQTLSTYEAVRRLAGHYLPPERMTALETGLVPKANATPEDCRMRLYARLYVAQIEALAWISIRDG